MTLSAVTMGRERVAQLVAEHGEELVLGAVRGLGLLARGARLGEQPRVVDGERRALLKAR
jgi:hypothetical protein